MRAGAVQIATLSLALGVTLSIATPAHADTIQAKAPREQLTTESVWYGPQLALAYGAAYALLGTGILLRQDDSDALRVMSSIALVSGFGVAVSLPPVIHWNHDRFGEGLASLGGQLGSAALGGLTGLAIADATDMDEAGTAFLLGAAVGHLIWAGVDVFVLGRTERMLERRITW